MHIKQSMYKSLAEGFTDAWDKLTLTPEQYCKPRVNPQGLTPQEYLQIFERCVRGVKRDLCAIEASTGS